MISDRFFPNFGNPVLENGTMYDFADISFGGGGGFTFNLNPSNLNLGGSRQPSAKEILTQIANSAESALQANLQAFNNGQISADEALKNAWDLLNRMSAAMMQYGDIGRKSAAERDRRIDPRFLRWDYIAYYIDPISQASTGTPATVPNLPFQTGGSASGGFVPRTAGIGAFGIGNEMLILLVLLGLIFWKAMKK